MTGPSESVRPDQLLQIEDCLDSTGAPILPPGTTLTSLIDRNIAAVPTAVAYRYLDFSGGGDRPVVHELTWSELGVRLRAVGAAIQRVTMRGDRAAILAPQGLDYVVGFFAAIKAGAVAVPLFAPELPGHAERLDTALHDARPAVVLTTTAARTVVEEFLTKFDGVLDPTVIVLDEVPDAAADDFVEVEIDVDDVSHLQYTGGTTRPPVGVEITHRAVGTNLVQMILAIDMLDRDTHGVSWLPLYHDMGLSMIGFPTVYGGHSTLMSPAAFIRRPDRWIRALSDGTRSGRVVTAAPNFAYEWAAQRGLPRDVGDEPLDLANVALIIGSEPVSMAAIDSFTAAFADYGLTAASFLPSYGIAEATLFVSTIGPKAEPTEIFVDRRELLAGRAVPVDPGGPDVIAQVSCGQVARGQWAVIVDQQSGVELPDGGIGEIWLQGNNIGRGYWDRPELTRQAFGARLTRTAGDGGHAAGSDPERPWLRTGDLGFHLDGQLYVVGRLADLVSLGDTEHYPHHIEATVADASPLVRRGYVTAFSVADDGERSGEHQGDHSGQRLVILAERATGTSRADPVPALAAIREAVAQQHGLEVSDVQLVPAGSIPRTTSGKLARWASRAGYLDGTLVPERSNR